MNWISHVLAAAAAKLTKVAPFTSKGRLASPLLVIGSAAAPRSPVKVWRFELVAGVVSVSPVAGVAAGAAAVVTGVMAAAAVVATGSAAAVVAAMAVVAAASATAVVTAPPAAPAAAVAAGAAAPPPPTETSAPTAPALDWGVKLMSPWALTRSAILKPSAFTGFVNEAALAAFWAAAPSREGSTRGYLFVD